MTETSTRLFALASAVALAAALTACGRRSVRPEQHTRFRRRRRPLYPRHLSRTQQVGVRRIRPRDQRRVDQARHRLRRPSAAAGTVIGAVVGGRWATRSAAAAAAPRRRSWARWAAPYVGNRIAGAAAPANYATTSPVYRVTVQTDQGQMRTYDVQRHRRPAPGRPRAHRKRRDLPAPKRSARALSAAWAPLAPALHLEEAGAGACRGRFLLRWLRARSPPSGAGGCAMPASGWLPSSTTCSG